MLFFTFFLRAKEKEEFHPKSEREQTFEIQKYADHPGKRKNTEKYYKQLNKSLKNTQRENNIENPLFTCIKIHFSSHKSSRALVPIVVIVIVGT